MESYNFMNYIGHDFGINAKENIKSYMNINNKLSKMIPRRIFLLRCRDVDVMPRFIINACQGIIKLAPGDHNYIRRYTNLYNSACKSLLNIEISSCCSVISKLKSHKLKLQCTLRRQVSYGVIESFFRNQNEIFDSLLINHHSKLRNKFDTLMHQHLRELNVVFDENCIVNLTGAHIPVEAKIILSFGPKFNMPTSSSQVPVINLIADIENILNDFRDLDDRNDLRFECSASIKNHIKHHRASKMETFLFHCLKTTKTFLRRYNNLYVTNSDNGNKTVIIERSEYFDKMSQMLNDNNTYLTLSDDPTRKLICKNNRIVKRLFEEHIINKLQRQQLLCETEISPRIYGLPKIHKENNPLRPVVSNTNTPGYKLAKFIGNILKDVINPQLNLKNSASLKLFLDNITLPHNNVLVSFDVESLYTNVDINLALDAIEQKWEEIEKLTPIDRGFFKEIVRFCASDCNYFLFNGGLFSQKFGLAMGNPLSSVLADLSMDMILSEALNNITVQPTFIRKYVDDIIAAIPEDDINQYITTLNNIHDKINFTVEIEDDNKIPFLDLLLVRRGDYKIITDWYCKPCSSNRILNYLSFHPHSMKVSVATNFTDKVLTLSNPSFHAKNIDRISNILTKNNYPAHIISRIVRNSIRKFKNKRDRTQCDLLNEHGSAHIRDVPPFYRSLTYIHPLSRHLKRKIDHHPNNNNNISLAMRPSQTLRSLVFTNLKDEVATYKKSNVVYKVDCKDCSQAYIGQTSKCLKTRLDQHQYYINKNTPSSALAAHSLQTKHIFNFDQAHILTSEKNRQKREIKEACLIISHNDHVVNLKRDMDCLHPTYHTLLRNSSRALTGNIIADGTMTHHD